MELQNLKKTQKNNYNNDLLHAAFPRATPRPFMMQHSNKRGGGDACLLGRGAPTVLRVIAVPGTEAEATASWRALFWHDSKG